MKDKLLTCDWRQKNWTSANADLFQGGWNPGDRHHKTLNGLFSP
ncbi:MAG: hypothetical protein WAW41_09730 [Methylobacter sp.]